ncbi:hypothetical protein B0I35DRAFT_477024 [Stachybotrys elegans]|uniref:Uncharacterized protein n=1 Tax=Stachybotrys elegans TaxID=80388 RepID=A0A8K0SWD0_9HYPO|nr:hypothetical protein B0I35DRAFT_477024 [Stachybotrys elegans]
MPGHDHFPFMKAIDDNGGVDRVSDECLKHVPREVLELQGKSVDRFQLGAIRVKQSFMGPWEHPAGYLDFVTDESNIFYLRFYVGQCNNPRRRILNQHCQQIMQSTITSLHHFIPWLGNGKRQVNFIRLWETPESPSLSGQSADSDNWTTLKTNILELVFCIAFRSLHGIEAVGNSPFAPSGYGLNVLSPLFQGKMVTEPMRLRARAALSSSPDIQIQAWVHFARAPKEHPTTLEGLMARTQSLDVRSVILKAVASEKLCEEVMQSITSAGNGSRSSSPSDLSPSIRYYGSLDARIAFLLDFAYGIHNIQDIQGKAIQGIHNVQGIQGKAIQDIQGKAIQDIQGKAIQGIQGKAIQGIQGKAIQGIQGRAIQGI